MAFFPLRTRHRRVGFDALLEAIEFYGKIRAHLLHGGAEAGITRFADGLSGFDER
ncbi:MAG: hypothetical protein MJA32_11750 [Proteobacteria bacterium]|nr:hypothetical protein [Pseudomonadota bacterium]